MDPLGHDPDFLGVPVSNPQADVRLMDDLLKVDGATVIPYCHFSLVMSRSRRLARWVAWDIDITTLRP